MLINNDFLHIQNSGSEYVKLCVKEDVFLSKVDYSGHSYIYFENRWNPGADQIFHDPDCVCKKDFAEKPKDKK